MTPEEKARLVCNMGDFPLITEDEAVCRDIDAVLERRQMARISNAILDTLDEGDEMTYAFWHPFESIADSSRILFRDRVIEKLRKR